MVPLTQVPTADIRILVSFLASQFELGENATFEGSSCPINWMDNLTEKEEEKLREEYIKRNAELGVVEFSEHVDEEEQEELPELS